MERFFKSEWLNQAISDLKIKRYTDIQFKTIPSILKNNNTIGVSETGTGKTYAYLFPILEKINTSLNNIQAIIILPTRELANQIYSRSIYFKKYNKYLKIKLLVGGSETEIVNKKIENNPPHILITTPQKFQELNSNFKLVLTNLNYIVLDEADMLIDLGFFGLIETIFNSIKNINNITKVAFSATLHEKLSIQLSKYFKNSKIFDVTTNIWTHKKINHHVIHYGNANKIEVLKKLLQKLNPYFCIIFANTKKDVDQIFDVLVKLEPNNIAKLHGDLTSRERKNTYKAVEANLFKYLVATDLASRGLDIDGASHIISFNMPKEDIWYVHRAGRSGRYNYTGNSYVFLDENNYYAITRLQKKGIVWNNIKFNKDDFIEFNYKFKKVERKETEVDVQIRKVISTASKKVKPNYKKKVKLQIQEIKRKAKRKRIEELVNEQRIKKYKMENAAKTRNKNRG